MSFYKFINFLVIFLLSLEVYAKDFAFVDDKDGYVNVRESASLDSKVTYNLKNKEFVRCVSTEESPKFCYVNSSNGKNGYVYKERLNFFKNYQKLELIEYRSERSIFQNKNLKIIFNAKKNNSKQKFKIFKSNSGKKVFLNNIEVYGTDNSIPDGKFSQLNDILIQYKDKKIILEQNDLNGIFFPTKGLNKHNEMADFQIFALKDEIYIFNTFNNGGAGEYNINFYLKNGILLEKSIWRTVF